MLDEDKKKVFDKNRNFPLNYLTIVSNDFVIESPNLGS